ncbi:hypothetical protein Mpsy_1941 [Methanolobus psychrophilus R15]|nr:hypothetical protein Mpsy_1941 [Methanolobus psychrophilus R15]
MRPLDFHLNAVDELLRVAEEVRICLPDPIVLMERFDILSLQHLDST